jgi:hypothetical protein
MDRNESNNQGATPMKIIRLTMRKLDFCGISAEDELTFSDARLRDLRTRWGFGAIPEGMEGRQVHQGPKVPGPWAFAFGLASCIDAHGITARKEADMQARGLVHAVEPGDILAFGEAPRFTYLGMDKAGVPRFRSAEPRDYRG